MVPQEAFWKIVPSDLLPICLLTRIGSLVKIAVSWPRRPPAQISLFLGSGWEVPFLYTVRTTTDHFWAWVAPSARFPYFWALAGMCLFSTSFFLQMVILGPGRLSGQILVFLGPGWDVPFQYKFLSTNGNFGAWAAQRPDSLICWALAGMCLFSTSFLLEIVILVPGRLKNQLFRC